MRHLEELFRKTVEVIAARQRAPESTYRIQFHTGFTFRDAQRIVPYLRELGITHFYSSPYLKARPGSTHGYDITDHNIHNPEIGTDEDFEAFAQALKDNGLGQILDMVPNHMGILGNENTWWNDVLENGLASPYAGFFDIDWYASPRAELQGRLLLPVLGEPYGKVLESGQLRLEYAGGAFLIAYFDHRFPVSPDSFGTILGQGVKHLEETLTPETPALLEYQSILTAVRNLPGSRETDPARRAERQREKEIIKRRLATLIDENPDIRRCLDETLVLVNGTAGQPRSFDLLDGLLDQQPYRLSWWRVAADEINYRRFFDINELAALCMEREDVFAAAHELVFRLLREDKIQGLRIDHPDGLFDPAQYLRRLQRRYFLECARAVLEANAEPGGLEWSAVEGPLLEKIDQTLDSANNGLLRRPLFVVVEKILAVNEPIPDEWLINGTSGYEFLNAVNGLFVDSAHGEAFRRLYREWINADMTFAEVAYQNKFLILQVALSSELHMLAYRLDRLAQKDRWSRDFTLNTLRHALREVIACFPVYRSYLAAGTIHDADRKSVQMAIKRAMARNPAINTAVFNFVRDVLLEPPKTGNGEAAAERLRFAGTFEQVTSPVMAKGVEDTAFYIYNCLLSLNEVGGNPAVFGISADALHRSFRERQAKWPRALSATSTHDTKRSEDVRARLNVLSEIPAQWQQALARWGKLNERHRLSLDEAPVPDANEEYFLYQTLVGAWPLEPYSEADYADFVARIQACMVKALHEAKVHSSWINPNVAYDEAVTEFVARILDEQQNREFLEVFQPFQRRISHLGLLNSLSQTLLKIAAPGAADVYQGTELWDFSLVDPDNRRAVDFNRRRRLLASLRERLRAQSDRKALVRELLQTKEDGCVKMFVLTEGLRCRREHPGLFAEGEYLPLETTGARKDHVFAFARRLNGAWAVAIVPRLLADLVADDGGLPLGPEVWRDTQIVLPEGDWSAPCTAIFTGERLLWTERENSKTIAVSRALSSFPVGLFLATKGY